MAVVVLTDLTPGTRALKGGPKRGLKGAMFAGTYRGPIIGGDAVIEGPATPTHATGDSAGGVEDSTGYRESDTYDTSGVGTSNTRPTGRTAYTGAGVQGGSTPGSPIDATGRAESAGKDRFGRTKGVANEGAGLGTYDYTNFDSRATEAGDDGFGLGSGRGVTVDGETVTEAVGPPTIGAAAGPAAGTIGIIDGGAGGTIDIDLHADDITGGAAGLAGFEVQVWERDTDDTDEDRRLLAFFSVDGGTDILDPAYTNAAIAGTTVALYARKRYPGRVSPGEEAVTDVNLVSVGPWSARATLAVT
jgi:hypothetical protein